MKRENGTWHYTVDGAWFDTGTGDLHIAMFHFWYNHARITGKR